MGLSWMEVSDEFPQVLTITLGLKKAELFLPCETHPCSPNGVNAHCHTASFQNSPPIFPSDYINHPVDLYGWIPHISIIFIWIIHETSIGDKTQGDRGWWGWFRGISLDEDDLLTIWQRCWFVIPRYPSWSMDISTTLVEPLKIPLSHLIDASWLQRVSLPYVIIMPYEVGSIR